jgi:hypothetical protein
VDNFLACRTGQPRLAVIPRPPMHNSAAHTFRVDSRYAVPELHTGSPRRSAYGLTRPAGLP